VLIYVGAVMVFMVYVIMLLDVRDASFSSATGGPSCRRWPSRHCSPWHSAPPSAAATIMSAERLASMHQGARTGASFEVQPFSVEFLERYWLHFELTSVLLLAAVVAAIAVIKAGRRHDG